MSLEFTPPELSNGFPPTLASKEGLEPESAILAEGLTRSFEILQRYGIDARLVGSLGRYAAIHEPLPSIKSSNSSGIKDIDLAILDRPQGINLEEVMREVRQGSPDLFFDVHFLDEIILENGRACIRYKDITEEVDPLVFAKKDGVIAGVVVPTLDPRTHLHLTALEGMRRKDRVNLTHYARLLKERKDILDEKYFEPFHILYRRQKREYPLDILYRKGHYEYQKYIPESVRGFIGKVIPSINVH